MSKKKYSEKEALKIVFEEKLKPSKMPLSDYNKFRLYRNRYKKDELKKDAIIKLLEYFGYISSNEFFYDKKKDKSKL